MNDSTTFTHKIDRLNSQQRQEREREWSLQKQRPLVATSADAQATGRAIVLIQTLTLIHSPTLLISALRILPDLSLVSLMLAIQNL